jgi:predicted O-methyltransferase YrrM
MAFTTLIKSGVNRLLSRVNLRIDTLTAERVEARRLEYLEARGHFQQPAFAVPAAFKTMAFAPLLEDVGTHESRFKYFEEPTRNDVGYTFANHYYTSPDAEILYTIIRKFQPQKIIEVGCGNSTKIMRQAIKDGQLGTRIISIDPHPRTEIRNLANEFHFLPVETIENEEVFDSLNDGDIFFIDSSHEIKTGNDNPFLYLNVLPKLRPGVLIQIHDIFLPYDYPREWVIEKRWGFNEQYLVQSLLSFSSMFEVLWAGCYLQRTLPDFAKYFPHLRDQVAKSLWIRKTS